MLSCEFCEISKNTFSYRTPPVPDSVKSYADVFFTTSLTCHLSDIFKINVRKIMENINIKILNCRLIEFTRDLQCQKYIALQRSCYNLLENFLWYVKLNNQNIQLKIQHKSLKINGKPRKIYPDNYPTLTKQFELLFITKQVLIENFLQTSFSICL